MLALAAVVALLPLPHVQAGAQGGATIGAGPYSVISDTAPGIVAELALNEPDCGLTNNQLIALALAPTWAENTGGTVTVAPSPMSLGRSDLGPTLSPSFDVGPSGAYWHTSIGLWQIDTGAGASQLPTAGNRVDVQQAAPQAMRRIALSWCFGRFESVYIPWLACRDGSCEEIYRAIYDEESDSLVNLDIDQTLASPSGGMESRTCLVSIGVKVACDYIDPQKAEGHKAFLVDDFGPAPITTPFYSMQIFGNETRVWLAEDDPGATDDVYAVVPGFQDPRTSTVWTNALFDDAQFCDLTARRGDCPPPCFGAEPTIWDTTPSGAFVAGGEENDVIVTGSGPDGITGGGGDDRICTGPGDDLVVAGEGNDLIDGFDGDDVIFGQGGDDELLGKNGDDRLRGGDGNDILMGGPDRDDLNGGRDDDTVDAGGGDDKAVRGGTGDDVVRGGPGNDELVNGNGGSDVVSGGNGDDLVIGGPRPDEVDGGPGADIVRGLGGADQVRGGDGNDELFGGRQPDTLDGGPGVDRCNGGSENDTALDSCESVTNVP